jgi:hypothetical protein
MAQYAHLEQINVLYLKSQQVALAINHLDEGGLPSSLTISPPPPQAPMPGSSSGYMSPGMSVTISLPGPFSPELLSEIRKQLVEMEADLASQLAALGVTATPPARTKRRLSDV